MSSNPEEKSSVEMQPTSGDVLVRNLETLEESPEKFPSTSCTGISMQLAESHSQSFTEVNPSCSKRFLCMECEEKNLKIKSLKRQVRRWRSRCMSLRNKVCI